METLIYIAHPDLTGSNSQSFLIEAAQALDHVDWVSVDNILEDWDKDRERHRFLAADRIIFQFPLYWYQAPAALKAFIDALLEVDSAVPGQERTGGVLTIPNSILLGEAVVNQTLAFSFQWHSVLIKVPQALDWQKAETALLEAGQEIWAEFDAEAEGQTKQLTHRFASKPDAREPEVFLGHGEDGKQTLELRIGLPVRQEHHVEDKILRAYYSKVSIHA